jgi:hypothetical protein
MSGMEKDRYRNKTIAFRVSPEEARRIEAQIKVCGMPKGEYFRHLVKNNRISIEVGKYKSDRLSLELRRLRECLQELEIKSDNEGIAVILMDCKALLMELECVTTRSNATDD